MALKLPTRAQAATLAWSFGMVVATIFVVFDDPPIGSLHLAPATPFDATRSGHAEQWRFLDHASAVVPPGSTFTVRTDDPEVEMSLFMMSVGLLPAATAVPNTYYGRPVAGGDGARFILVFGEESGSAGDESHTTAVAGGLIVERQPSMP